MLVRTIVRAVDPPSSKLTSAPLLASSSLLTSSVLTSSLLTSSSSSVLSSPFSSSSPTMSAKLLSSSSSSSSLSSSSSSLSSSFSTSAIWSKKKKSLERDPVPFSVEREPFEETLPTDDREPRPNSVADKRRQLTIKETSLEGDPDPKLQLKWSKPVAHLETPTHPGEYVVGEWPPKGRVYWKLPFKVKLQADRVYKWCSCGTSKTQPFCDGKSHHYVMDGPDYQKPSRPKFRPTQFKVPETGDYWLCQCKQTNDRPFCDGSHRVIEEVLEIERPMLTDGKRVPVKLKK